MIQCDNTTEDSSAHRYSPAEGTRQTETLLVDVFRQAAMEVAMRVILL